jgi:hypothetical protein
VVAPPDIPADRLALLRRAFREAVDDPQFHADAATQRLALDPIYGDEAQAIIRRLYATPPEVVERMRKIVQLGAEP